LLFVGTGTDQGTNQIVNTTFTGIGGSLVVLGTNSGSAFVVQQGSTNTGPHIATLDLSGLGTFNLAAGRLLVAGNAGSPGASNYLAGTLTLAKTNVIQLNGTTAPALNLGDATTNPNSFTNFLILGQTNALFVDTITVGRAKQTSTLKFNPSLAGNNPALYLRGNSATRVSALALGDNASSGTSSTSLGMVDLSLGTVDAQVNACYVGRGQPGTGTGQATGLLALNAGVFNVNTLNLATGSTNTAVGNVAGTVNVTGTATLVVNSNLALGINPGITNTARGTLSITNGTVFANAISTVSTGAVISVIAVNSGQLTITNSAGTPGVPLAALNLTSASLHLNANPLMTNIVATNVTGTATITIDSIAYTAGTTMTFPLISYQGADPYASLTLASLGTYSGSLVDNSGSKRIDLQITAGPTTPILGSIVWGGGANNNWDTASLNWTNSGITTLYADTDLVNFNDLGQTGSVNLAATVSPGSVTVSNAAVNYTISGTGSISGAGGLTKGGVGTLTLGTANSYAGGTVINAGTVTTTVAGALPAATIVNFSAATNATLNLQGTAQTLAGMTFGNNNSNAANAITITGTSGSALTVSLATLTLAPLTVTNNLALNLAGLSSFNYNNSSGTITVNNGSAQQNGSGQVTVALAGGTNLITTGTLNVGTGSTSSGVVNSTVKLGGTNTLDVGTINIGSGRAGGTIQFASGIANGTLTIAGVTGGSSLATLAFGSHDSFSVSDKPVDLFDTTAGTLNAQFGAMTIGVMGATANSSGRGIVISSSFKMGAGTLTASNLTLGAINNVANVTNYTATITSLFSITNGGTASITNLTLANNNLPAVGTGADNLTNNATVSLTNGATMNATTIQMGNAASPSVTSAVLSWGDGTVGNIPGGGLTVNGISVVLSGTANNHNVNITAGQTGLINSWISGTGTLTDVGSGALTLGGNNSFNGSLVMAGTNTLTLTKTNTYTGSTLINSGTLLLGASGSISNSPTINVASNAVFDLSAVTGGFSLAPVQSLAGSGGVNGSVNAMSGSQIIPGGTGVPGTLTFSNNLTLNGQTLTFDLSASPASSNDLVNVVQTLSLNANTTILLNELSGSLAASSSYTLMTYGSIQANSHNFILVAPRGVSLNVGANALTLNVGVVSNASLTWVGDGTQNNWNVQTTTNWSNGGALDYFYQFDSVMFDKTGPASPAVNLTTTLFPTNVTVNGSQNYTFSGSGQLAGLMTLTNNGTGTLTLNNSNTYSGGTVINAGTVQLTFTNAAANLPDLAAATGPILDNGTLNITNNGGAPTHILITNTISGSGGINLPQNQEISFNSPGSMANFNGTINIPAGVVTTAKGDILGASVNLNSAAVINVANGGTLWVSTSGVVVPASVNLSGLGNAENWGALRVDSGATFSGPVNLLGNASIGAQNTISGTISGAITDGGSGYSVTKLGAQPVILTGANTYSGGTTISNGTLQVGSGLVNGTLPGNVNLAVSNTTLTFMVATNTSLTYNGAISGSGSLVENGNGYGGTLNLNGVNNFTNSVTITAGALWITNAGALGTGPKQINISNGTAGHPELHLNGISGNILVPSTISFVTSWSGGNGSQGALINEAGNNEIDGNFNLTSGGGGTAIVVNGGTLKLAGTLAPSTTGRTLQFGGAGNGIVSGVIADGSGANYLTAVTIVGPGMWTFAGTNTYITNTIVSGGTLLVNGTNGPGPLTVQTNAALGGTGTIGGATTLQIGTQLTAGNGGIGTLTFTNSLTLNATATNNFNVTTAGGASNLVAVAGVLRASNSVVRITSGTPLHPGTNTLFTYGSIIGAFNPTVVFDVAPVHPAALLDSGSGQINLVVSNRPPAASVMNVTRLAGSPAKIALTDLATNWSDPDGDAVTMSALNLVTTNGVNLTTDSTWIYYTNNLNVNDQISYTINDGLGGTNVGYINILIQASVTGTNSIANIVSGNPTTLTAYGIPGYNYITERATNLVSPVWVDILTNAAATNGVITVTDYFGDLGSNAPASAYYRLKWQP
jgi:autotransporter-associated beta strand protein